MALCRRAFTASRLRASRGCGRALGAAAGDDTSTTDAATDAPGCAEIGSAAAAAPTARSTRTSAGSGADGVHAAPHGRGGRGSLALCTTTVTSSATRSASQLSAAAFAPGAAVISAERSDSVAGSCEEAVAATSTLLALSVRSRHAASAPVLPPAAPKSTSTAPATATGALVASLPAAAGCLGELGVADADTILRQLGSGMGPGALSGSPLPHHAASGAGGRAPPSERAPA